MEVQISWNEGTVTQNVSETESDVFEAVGRILENISVPNSILVTTKLGDAAFTVGRRGSFVKNGVRKPSMYVVPEYNNIYGLQPSMYPERYLTCINPESNNYKFYHLKPCNRNGVTDHVGATYGRIGSERGEPFGVKDLQQPYDSYLFWIRYYEKLSKGYTDQSDIYLSAAAKPKKTLDVDAEQETTHNAASAELYELLQSYARHVVKENLVNTVITKKQISESKKIWKALCNRKTVNGFNAQLMKLLTISPRKTRYVNTLLATRKEDFADIIDREETLINAMEACVNGDRTALKKLAKNFDSYGIEVYEANDRQRASVEAHLSDLLKGKVQKVWRVIPKEQQKRFDKYLKDNHIKSVKQFWHGSRNENWFSILTNGLSLHPHAAITGKMLGNGVYFAPSSLKSWNYTSYHGTYWANGRSDTAFMGLYATAYGTPLDATNDIRSYSAAELKTRGCNCVHAKGGPGTYLKNDEVVFFNEDAMVLNYIVEFR